MTFKLSKRSLQRLEGVKPDLVTLAKSIGGGLPLAAFGGTAEVMQVVVDGRMAHFGTYNGNPLVMAAAEAVDEVCTQEALDAAEGIGRASTGRAELDDWTRRLTPWQPLVEVHPGLLGLVRDKAAPLRDKDRALVGARFGLGGSPPMTNAAVAEEFGATPARVVSAYRRARRALRDLDERMPQLTEEALDALVGIDQ